MNVVAFEKRSRVYPGGTYFYDAKPGYMLVDLGVKVTNLTSSGLDVKWNDIYLMNAENKWWYPRWGTFKASTNSIDPLTLGVSENKIEPEVFITLDNSGYLRLFYLVTEAEVMYFGFADSALTELHFK